MRLVRPFLLGLMPVLLLAGCGSYEAQITAPGGADGSAGQIAIRDARFATDPDAAGDDPFQVGDDAPLTFTAVNTGDATDRLLGVSSPVAGGSELGGDTQILGGFALVSGYTTGPTDGTVFTTVGLTDLREPLRPGLTYPVTFVFERGGAVTLQMPTEIRTADPTPSPAPAY